MSTACVVIHNLRVSFGDREILHNLSVEFPANRISVILGPSGSGKSTLLRSINRLNELFDGYHGDGEVQILLNNRLIPVSGDNSPELTELRRKAGMVFQSPNPLPVSIRKNITLPLELAFSVSGREKEKIVRERLEQVGLWDEVKDRLDNPALSLSGGQQQRLCLARTLALKPELLLLDEPTASLDRSAAEKVEDMILSLKATLSIVMVSHNLQQAAKLADHIVIMRDGNIAKTSDARNLRSALNLPADYLEDI